VNFLDLTNTYTVENSVTIYASPSMVWKQLGEVELIQADEFDVTLTSLIGVPRPVKASMSAEGIGAVRTSEWERGFREVITHWEPNKKMTYSFDIDPEAIPDHALDKYVKLGGEYFSPLNGGYYLSEDSAGNTVLTLKTRLLDNTNFSVYSRVWGELIFRDFHDSLLKLMKSRSEKFTHNKSSKEDALTRAAA
jgi:Polyketide cyclase / dehydrase and lipid transport.